MKDCSRAECENSEQILYLLQTFHCYCLLLKNMQFSLRIVNIQCICITPNAKGWEKIIFTTARMFNLCFEIPYCISIEAIITKLKTES